MAAERTERCQVVVVGAGPAGLVAAVALVRYGISVVVVEKRESISTLSRALVISTRSMEMMRAWGLEDAVRAGAAEVEPCGWVIPTLISGDGVEIPLGYPTVAEAAAVSPTRPAWAPQDHLEPLLMELLVSHPSAQLRFGTELIGLEQEGAGVLARVVDRASGSTSSLSADFLVGADGAHSGVRALLGIRLDGADDLAEFHGVQFSAPLWDLLGDRRYGINVITGPEAASVIAPRGPGDRWTLARECRPGQDRLVDMAPDGIARLIQLAVGVADLPVRVERVSSFSFAAQLADRYRVGSGFVVGDAAHRMTPRGGTGMNTAIHDAFDLGWKLAWVLRGWAGRGLLASYESERRPAGAHNVERSGDPGGARRTTAQALPQDLNGRVAHRWLSRAGGPVSTLDLLGAGLTLLTADDATGWEAAAGSLVGRVPVAAHPIGVAAAASIGVPPGGALLLRPDGRLAASWPHRAVAPTSELAELDVR